MSEYAVEELLKLGLTNGLLVYMIYYMTKNITQKLDLIIAKLDSIKKG